jgi:predicted acyl esterase
MQNVQLIRTVRPKAGFVDGKTCIEDEVRDLRVQFTDDTGRKVNLIFDGHADVRDQADWPFSDERREVYSLHPEVTILQDEPNKAAEIDDLSVRPMSQVVDALLGSPDPVVPKVAIITAGGVVQEVRVDAGDADITIFDYDEECGLAMLRDAFPVVVY